MKSVFHFAAALAVSSTLLAHGSAMAEGSATASLSNIQLGVLDLTPNDGIAAGYDIGVISTRLTAAWQRWPDRVVDESAPDPYQSGTARIDRGTAFAQSHTGGAIGDLASVATWPTGNDGEGRLSALPQQSVWLTLRPFTVLTVSGNFDLLAQRAPEGTYSYISQSYGLARIYHEESNSYFEARRSAVAPASLGATITEVHDDFLLSYANNSNHDLQVELYFDLRSEVDRFNTVPLPSVPEPETWSMLGLGLAVLGMAARRRRRQG